MKSSGKTDSLRIGLKLDLFSGLPRRPILSDSPLASSFRRSVIHATYDFGHACIRSPPSRRMFRAGSSFPRLYRVAQLKFTPEMEVYTGGYPIK